MSDYDDEQDFDGADAGASKTFPSQASAVRKNGHMVIKSRPCKIVEMSTSKTGKHGHAKIHFVGIDIFTQKKYEDIVPSTHNVDVPHVKRQEFQLIDISDGFMSLMDESGGTKDDVRVPSDDLGKNIEERFANEEQLLVSVITSMGEECAISVKNMPKTD